ncbi:MAG: TonB family protein [Opitutales bacterium]
MRLHLPKTPFQISLSLHLSIFLVFTIGGLFQGCSEPEEEFLFEIVNLPAFDSAPPSPPSVAPQPEATPEPEPIDLPEPTFSQLEPARERPVVEVEREPRPEPQVTIPEPTPEPVKPEPVEEKPLKRMTLEEFRKQHGEPQTPTRRETPRQPTPRIDIPSINTNQITQSLENAANTPTISQPSSNQRALEEARYKSKIRSILNGLWNPRKDLPSQNLLVEVEFTIDGNGRVTRYRITRRSGLTWHDESVEEIFRNLGSLPVPPGRRSVTYRIPFQVE